MNPHAPATIVLLFSQQLQLDEFSRRPMCRTAFAAQRAEGSKRIELEFIRTDGTSEQQIELRTLDSLRLYRLSGISLP